MPHTNNPNAQKRKASRSDAPKFLRKKSKPNHPNPIDIRASQNALIGSYHALEKLISASSDPKEIEELRKQQEEMGGLQAYQEASLAGGDKMKGGETGKWCVKMLKELKIGVDKQKDKGKGKEEEEKPTFTIVDGKKVWPKVEREKLRLLDVGAISGTSYASYPWIDVTSIDLHPQAPHVLQADFFEFPVPAIEKEKFDVVALSLVMNFVGSLEKRGEMLIRAHQFLRPKGVLYIVLPLPCLTNSRYLNPTLFRSILTTTLWNPVRQHDSAKLTYWLCSRMSGNSDGKVWKRKEVRGGVKRNNFCIVVNAKGEEGEKVVEEEESGEKEEVEGEEEWGGVEGENGAEEDAQEEEEEWGGVNGEEEEEEAEWGGVETSANVDEEAAEEEEEWGGI